MRRFLLAPTLALAGLTLLFFRVAPANGGTQIVSAQFINDSITASTSQRWAQNLGSNLSGSINSITLNLRFYWSYNSSLIIQLCSATTCLVDTTPYDSSNPMPESEQGIFVERKIILDDPIILLPEENYFLNIICLGNMANCDIRGSIDSDSFPGGNLVNLSGCPPQCSMEDAVVKDAYFILEYEDRIETEFPLDTSEPPSNFEDWGLRYHLSTKNEGKARVLYGTNPGAFDYADEIEVIQGSGVVSISKSLLLSDKAWHAQAELLDSDGNTLATSSVVTFDAVDYDAEVLASQTVKNGAAEAWGMCQILTGLSGTLEKIVLKVRFDQSYSNFYPANGDIGTNGLDFGRHIYVNNPAPANFCEAGDGGNRPFLLEGYDPEDTTTFQVLTFIPQAPVELDPSEEYVLNFNLQSSAQRFQTLGSHLDTYSDGAAYFMNPFTPWKAGEVADLYFVLKGAERKVPIVIVPGILGTRLNRVSDGVEVWPDATQMAQPLNNDDEYLAELQLDNDGNELFGNEMGVAGVIEKEVVPLWFDSIYMETLVNELESQGYSSGTTLFTVPYDWRLNLRDEVDHLGAVIQTAIANSSSSKIDIIAHSMGGLLVKEYLRQAGDTSFVNKLIFAGTPQIGSPKTFKVLNYGDDMDMVVLSEKRIKEITQNMPAVYELLPSERYFDLYGGYVTDHRFDIAGETLDQIATAAFLPDLNNPNDVRNLGIFADADEFHDTLDHSVINGPEAYSIVGCQQSTIGGFRVYKNKKVDIIWRDGDGTVPLTSSLDFPGDHEAFFVLGKSTGSDHTGLIKDTHPLSLISNILNGQANTLPSGVSTSSSDCAIPPSSNQTTLMISTHSPVALHVYDEGGNHTGLLENGGFEFGIPSSVLESIDGNTFVLVPAGMQYTIHLDALSSGSFDLKIRELGVDAISTAITYINVPLESASTTAELTYTDVQGNLDLLVDNDGDGDVDVIFGPTGILDETMSSDVTPPRIAMPNIPIAVKQGTDILFDFWVADDLSGVAYVNADLDGVPIQQNDIIKMNDEGVHIFTVSTADKAGNPNTESVRFIVKRPLATKIRI